MPRLRLGMACLNIHTYAELAQIIVVPCIRMLVFERESARSEAGVSME